MKIIHVERRGFTLPKIDTRTLGRKGKPDLFYTTLASEYVGRLNSESRRPVKVGS